MIDVENKAKQRQFSIATITHSELEKSGMNIKETMRQKKDFNDSFMSAQDDFNGNNQDNYGDMTIDHVGVSRIHHKNDITHNETMYHEFENISPGKLITFRDDNLNNACNDRENDDADNKS